MAVRDGAKYLPQAIESILLQTLEDFELIVVDDGSVDTTPGILSEFERQDRRLHVIHGSRKGASIARNRAGRDVRSQFLAVMDADDIALRSRLELQVRFLDSHPEVAVVGGTAVFIDEDGTELGTHAYPEGDQVNTLLRTGQSPVIHPAAAMRTDAFRAVSGYRPLFEVAYDYDLWLRMADRGRITNIQEPVLRYRLHTGQTSTQSLRRTAEEVCVALASARARRQTSEDPLDSVTRLDPAVVASLGVKPEEIAAWEVHFAVWLARLLAHGGREDLAKPLWSTAMNRAGATATSRATRARVLRARADTSSSQPRSFALLMAAAGLDPQGAVARLRPAQTGAPPGHAQSPRRELDRADLPTSD
jgi:hypothetical protein